VNYRVEKTEDRIYQPAEKEQQSTVTADEGSEEEQKIVDMVTAPGGVRAAPARDQLDQFIKKFVSLSVCLLACLSVCMLACLCVCQLVCVFVSLSICVFVSLSICVFVSLSVCLSACLSMCLLACLSVCLSACLCVCQYCYRCKSLDVLVITDLLKEKLRSESHQVVLVSTK